MRVKKLIINSIRNHLHTELEFNDRLNVLYGLNGAGKTTILESIHLCAFSKTFLPVPDSSLVSSGEDFYQTKVSAEYDLNVPYNVSIKYSPGKRKEISSTNGDHLPPKAIIGELPLVVLSPDFKSITFGSPRYRRQFVDKALSIVSKLYIDDMLRLKKCLKQRNNLLAKAKFDRSYDYSLIEPWTELLIKTGAEIVYRRYKFIDEFVPFFKEIYWDLTDGKENVDLYYMPDNISVQALDGTISRDDIISIYQECYNRLKDNELRRGTTLFGPQKDEIKIMINSGVAKEFASQGQHKSLLISIKFAEFNYLKSIKQETPVILLDDIFSELDTERGRKVIDLVTNSSSQTFVTVTNTSLVKNFMPLSENCSYYKVENGTTVKDSINNL